MPVPLPREGRRRHTAAHARARRSRSAARRRPDGNGAAARRLRRRDLPRGRRRRWGPPRAVGRRPGPAAVPGGDRGRRDRVRARAGPHVARRPSPARRRPRQPVRGAVPLLRPGRGGVRRRRGRRAHGARPGRRHRRCGRRGLGARRRAAPTGGGVAAGQPRSVARSWSTPSLTDARADPVADVVVPVTHSGELLGALVVRSAAAAASPVERVLVADLAAQAGLVLRNVALTAELQARLVEISSRSAEISASRARLVAAQDAERRRLERDIHDGAQQHLVALVVNLRLAQTLAGRAPERAATVLRALHGAVRTAERTLRDLARGVYPAALERGGLAAALAGARPARAAAPARRRRPGPLRPGASRRPPTSAASRPSRTPPSTPRRRRSRSSSPATSRPCASPSPTTVSGFDPDASGRGSGLDNMADRISALGGTMRVTSGPGRRHDGRRLPAGPPARAAPARRAAEAGHR